MKKILTVELKNNISETEKLSEVCEQFALQYNLSPITANAITLSLDEIVTNIISYGYDDNKCHKIFIDFFVSEKLFKAVISDDGRKFNPLDQPEADISLPLEDKDIGGLGLHLVRNLMDQITYNYENDKNVLTITKEIRF
jgi:anti-sigma regulatory factor (Ser/Thr protein kinase)